MCNIHVETILHTLRECTKARQVWVEIILHAWRSSFFNKDLRAWMLQNITERKFRGVSWNLLFGFVIWNLWICRNKAILTEDSRSEDVSILCHRLALSFLNAQHCEKSLRAGHVSRNTACWELLVNQVIKLNVDATLNCDFLKVLVGIIARSNTGLVLFAQSHHIGSCSSLFAELWLFAMVLSGRGRMGTEVL